ncbi:hypothetical protein [Streptomyces sp. NPDC001948]
MPAHISFQALVLIGIAAVLGALVALLASVAAVYLSRRDGATWPAALQRGAIAICGTLKLILMTAALLAAMLPLLS